LNLVDNIDIGLPWAREFDDIATFHVFEAAKKTVTVARDAEIAAEAGSGTTTGMLLPVSVA
jgi:hypothetical protein